MTAAVWIEWHGSSNEREQDHDAHVQVSRSMMATRATCWWTSNTSVTWRYLRTSLYASSRNHQTHDDLYQQMPGESVAHGKPHILWRHTMYNHCITSVLVQQALRSPHWRRCWWWRRPENSRCWHLSWHHKKLNEAAVLACDVSVNLMISLFCRPGRGYVMVPHETQRRI